jgi:hypothetical protein
MAEPLVAKSASERVRRPGGDDPGEAWGWSGSFRRLCYRRGASIASSFLALCVLLGSAAATTAQVDAARLEHADQDPANWLIYGRTYSEQRFSPLARITADNANQLGLAWYADFDINRGQEAVPLIIEDGAVRQGSPGLRFGLGWAKSHSFHTGQTPVLRYNRQLMQAILRDRLPIAEVLNVKVITLDEAPDGYRSFDAGVPNKFVIDPHGLVPKAA